MKIKKIIIVGATAQLVEPLIYDLAKKNQELALVSRDTEKLKNLYKKVLEVDGVNHEHIKYYIADSAVDQQVEDTLSKIKEFWWGDVDSLLVAIGSAGIPGAKFEPGTRPSEINIEAFRQGFEVNFWYVMKWMFAVSDWMWDLDKVMRVVLFGSISEDNVLSMVGPYASGKCAMTSMMKTFAVHVAQERQKKRFKPILFNRIVPGFFPAEQNKKMLIKEDGTFSERGKAIISRTPIGKLGSSEDLTSALEFLLLNSGDFMNMAEIKVDGGFNGFSGVHTPNEVLHK